MSGVCVLWIHFSSKSPNELNHTMSQFISRYQSGMVGHVLHLQTSSEHVNNNILRKLLCFEHDEINQNLVLGNYQRICVNGGTQWEFLNELTNFSFSSPNPYYNTVCKNFIFG